MIRALGVGLCLGVALVAAGCGQEPDLPDRLPGADVATMAERELEAENPTMARGTMTCPALDLEVGASVRCLRTAELDEGRIVKVRGTVAVTSRDDGGRLHVEMDDTAEEFGVAGEHLAAELRRWYAARFHLEPRGLTCPYLEGSVGATVVCRVDGSRRHATIEVEATAADPGTYRVDYRARARRAAG